MIHNNPGILRNHSSEILFLQRILDPTIAIILLIALAQLYDINFEIFDIPSFAIIVFLLILPIFKAVGLYRPYRTLSIQLLVGRLLVGWSILLVALLVLGYITKTSHYYARSLLLTWSVCVPITLFGMHIAVWRFLQQFRKSGRNSRSAVIVGLNTISQQLIDEIASSPELGIRLHGFFDDSYNEEQGSHHALLKGNLSQVAEYVRKKRIDVVYITCSTEQKDQVTTLLQDLLDTTACVYFVPDVLTFHLMHGRPYEINGIPLVAIWEVPFTDVQYLLKRSIDVIVATLAVVLLFPVMVCIAIAVKLSSSGPIFFRQRRYGLHGQEIMVYKFRSMRVQEDGAVVTQAKRGDSRVTTVGAFLRKTSLDELPQFINVLQGRMSIVGPRPHAVAHNEMYRKLIDGYMLRHKVKPGITGWAQVNGCRGETETLEKMQKRIDYDLDYLKNWSLQLDCQIIMQTCFVFLRDQNAY
ncbi:MAG: undecaprenyl-phosphate glucose phosphotransferase [Leptolyngbyaceae cyanobacterium MAG.088]|nr:undecaprenyl-phosphate glucose phosphotransferase [Leptolyngbyaceae cyanobacterium MAG.088]